MRGDSRDCRRGSRLLKLLKNYEPHVVAARRISFLQVHQRGYTLGNYRSYFKEDDRRSR
jgi:hypothetical protein